MKKFLIASASILGVIIVLFVTLACIKPQSKFTYGEPTKVCVYAKSSSALQNGKGESSFSPTSVTYRNIMEKTEEIFKVSMFDYAVHGDSVYPVTGQDLAGEYSSYSSSLLNSKYSVSFTFDETQKQVVVCDGDKKTIEYKKIIILIDPDKNYQTVPVYFSTSESGSYEKNPMVVNIRASKLIRYINEIK